MITRLLLFPDATGGAAIAEPPPKTEPAPSPETSTASSPTPGQSDGTKADADNVFAELDRAFEKAGAPPVKPEEPKTETLTNHDTKKAESTKAVKAPEDKRAPNELRAELDRVKGELKSKSDTEAALQSKIAEYESKGKDTAALVARLEANEKERQDLLSENRALKREASPDFKKNFETPFNEAADATAAYVAKVIKPDGTKADLIKDFKPLYYFARETTFGQALAKAKEIFGDDEAPEIISQIRDLSRLQDKKDKALEEEKKGWEAKEKEQHGQTVQRVETFSGLYKKVATDLQNSVNEYRDPPDDKEASDLRKQGRDVYAAATRMAHRVVMQYGTAKDLQTFAHMQERVAAFGPNQLQIRRLNSKVAELTKALEESKSGKRPGTPQSKPTGGNSKAQDDSVEAWGKQLKEAVEAAV